MNTYYQEQWAISEKTRVKQVTGVGPWISRGYWRRWNFQGSIILKKRWDFHRSVHAWQTDDVEWLSGNQKIFWLFGLVCIIHLPASKIFFKFYKIFRAEERTYLNSSHKFIQYDSFLKMRLWHYGRYVFGEYNISLGMVNKMRNLWCFISIAIVA